MKKLKDILRTRFFVDFTETLDIENIQNMFSKEYLDKVRPEVDEETQLLIDDVQTECASKYKSKEGVALHNEYKALEEKICKTLFEVDELESEHLEIANILSENDKDACFVGGCVRDAAIGEIPKDYDFCTKIPYDDLKEIFINHGYKVKEKGKQFLVLIVSKDGCNFEIANFRKDKDNEGASTGTIEEDAQRRDFTINAGYIRISDRKLLDPNAKNSVGFLDDIKTRTLRFIGKPGHRLVEDPNRVFRFYRFCSKGFDPEHKSLQAVRANFSWCLLNTAPERVREEMERISLC